MIRALTEPASIAVIGASTRRSGLSARPLDYLQRYGFRGQLFVVRPDGAPVLGVPAARTIADLPDDVDLAMITLPAGPAVEAYAACQDRGIKAAVMIASGFESGSALERSLRRVAARGPTRLIGPNCVGFLNAHKNLYATVASSFLDEPALRGGVGIVTQSGGLGNALVAAFAARGIGISSWYSSGSEYDVGALEIIRSLICDPDTSVITAFVEGLREGEELGAVGLAARQANKRILMLKGGLSSAGKTSARLHTGKASSGPEIWRDVAAQAGISLASSVEELVDATALTLRMPAGQAIRRAPRIVILSASGGLGVLLADRCDSLGIPLATLSRVAGAELAAALGLGGRLGNPIDIGAASDEQVCAAIELLVRSAEVDAVLLAASRIASKDYHELGECLRRSRAKTGELLDKVIVSFLGPADVVTAGERSWLEPAAAIVDSPFRALDALSKARRPPTPLAPGAAPGVRARAPGGAPLHWANIERLARRYKLPLVPSLLVGDEESAVRAARRVGFPVAMKVVAPALWHRTDLGLIRVGLTGPDEVAKAFRELQRSEAAQAISDLDGALIQPMITAGIEVIIGVRWDAELGPIVSAGLGGTAVELLGEVRHRQLPASRRELGQLVGSGRLGTLLTGFRGSAALDHRALTAAVEAAARLFAREPGIGELEMNPVIVTSAGAYAVDLKIAPYEGQLAGAGTRG